MSLNSRAKNTNEASIQEQKQEKKRVKLIQSQMRPLAMESLRESGKCQEGETDDQELGNGVCW